MIIKVHPVIIPPHLELSRNIKKNIRHIDGKPLDKSDLSQYDRKTIFYDVFFNPDNTMLYALGPPLLNLEHELSPISVSVNSSEVQFKLVSFGPSILYMDFNNRALQKLLKEENNISISFGNKWTWQGSIPLNKPQDEAMLTLCSVQKNNRIKWIKDWIKYYREEVGVGRIILYDNNSDYQLTLDQELNNIPNVYIVHWNFLFGPFTSHQNKFCQLGSLNHCRLKFSNGKFCLNFDIDEILVIKNKEKLFNKMNQYEVIYFDTIPVPFIKPSKENYSFSDFVLRKQISRAEEGHIAYKYIYQFAGVRLASTHQAITNSHGPIVEALSKLLKRLNQLSIHYFKFPLDILIRYDLELKNSYKFDIEDAYFLHFMGITTNWKSNYSNRLTERKDTSDLVEDRSIAEFFER